MIIRQEICYAIPTWYNIYCNKHPSCRWDRDLLSLQLPNTFVGALHSLPSQLYLKWMYIVMGWGDVSDKPDKNTDCLAAQMRALYAE